MIKFSSHYYDKTSTFHGFVPNVMGTRFDLIVVDVSNELSNSMWSNIVVELERLHNMLNRFDSNSELSRINLKAVNTAFSVSTEMWEILTSCKYYYLISEKLFDISLNDFSKVFLEKSTKSIKLPSSDYNLDLGGYAKGYAIEKVKNILITFKIKHALVNFGDSSIAAIGHHPFGDSWSISIENPFNKGDVLKEIKLVNEDLSTSGNTPGYHNHIFNPISKEFIKYKKIVCVKSKNSIDAEVLSTTLMLATNKQREKIESNFNSEEIFIFKL